MINEARNQPNVQHGEDTSAALKLWVVMNRAHRAIGEKLRGCIEGRDLHPTEFGVLEILYHKGELTVGEIGSGVLISSGSTTHVINKLEERGLVERRGCSDDRRIFHVRITEAGTALMSDYFPEHAEAVRAAMAGLTTEEKRIAAALLKRLGRYITG